MLGYKEFIAKDDFYIDDGYNKFKFFKGCRYLGVTDSFDCKIYDENDNAIWLQYYPSCMPRYRLPYTRYFEDATCFKQARNKKAFAKCRKELHEDNANKRLSKQLTTAIVIATTVHKDQFDKAGAPYILHPLFIMNQMPTLYEKIVAILHDVVEDSHVTLDELKDTYNFETKVVRAVEALTRKENESYMDFIKRACKNKIAREVKLKDLRHNLTASRLKEITIKDQQRIDKYKKAYDYILKNYYKDVMVLR